MKIFVSLVIMLVALVACAPFGAQYGYQPYQAQQSPQQAAAASQARLQAATADIYSPPSEFDKKACPISYGASLDAEENAFGVSWNKQASYAIRCGNGARIGGY